MVVAEGTAEALGPDAQIDRPIEDRQLAQESRRVQAVRFGVWPQRRPVVLISVLATVMMNSPSLVRSVCRMRTSGMSRGIEMSGCFGISTIHERCGETDLIMHHARVCCTPSSEGLLRQVLENPLF
jgi:hypothetical protein